MEGNLARSLVKLKELDALFPDASVQDKVKSFEAFGAATAESVESLRYAYAMPGDLLFTPAACIVSEKGLNSDCICLRVQALLASPNMVEDYRAMLKDFPGSLSLFSQRNALFGIKWLRPSVCKPFQSPWRNKSF